MRTLRPDVLTTIVLCAAELASTCCYTTEGDVPAVSPHVLPHPPLYPILLPPLGGQVVLATAVRRKIYGRFKLFEPLARRSGLEAVADVAMKV